MNNKKTYFRQTHLDFHTSPDIEGIASRFTKENFQKAIKKGKLDSITVFAKCHHGLCYYPTKVGTVHPHLDFDFTGAMIDAAHEIGVRAPVYITAGFSHEDAIAHPEWIVKKADGSYDITDTYELDAKDSDSKRDCAWHLLCLNDGPYAEHIYELTEEICQRYKDLDGLFYDICLKGDVCYCDTCVQGMREMGLDPEKEKDAKEYFIIKRRVFMQKCTDIMKKYHPDATIFFNSGGANPERPQFHEYQTHYEMENLPTAWGGYDKLPLRSKFFKNKEKSILAMTGKFHLDWGEFGGFKTKEALKAEIAQMAVYGVGASVGDHMHPDGEMEMQTYENIGYAYDYLEKVAPFCYDGEIVSNIGVYVSDDWVANEGISRILIENQIDYRVVDNNCFEIFDTVIISEGAVMDKEGLDALNAYIKNGGKVLLMADALVKDGEFQIDTGLKYIGRAEFDCDYIIANESYDDVPNAPTLSNVPGHRTENIDATIYAQIMTPYFSRTYGRFCGHKNTPHNKDSKLMPAIAKKGNVVYIANSLPKQYRVYGSVFHKRYFMHALNLIYSGSLLKVSGIGSQGRCTMIEQPHLNRYCINMLYINPVIRGQAGIIEDIMPVYNIQATLRTDKKIKNIYIGLTNEKIDFIQNQQDVSFVVPKLECHTSIVVEY